ncbi:T9SS type A sorting domain-containing protein, partial [Psychroserpens algicola]
ASDEDSVTVIVNELPATDAGADVTISEGESTTLTATGADTYLWSTGATTPSITVSPNSSTAYTVTGFSNNCESSDEVLVTVNIENVTADAGLDVTICNGESTTLTATGGTTYVWSTGETTASITVNPNTTTNYTVTAFNTAQTASGEDSVTVTVNELPVTDAGADTSIFIGESTTLTATGADSYVWSTGETTASIVVTPNETTLYTVTGISNGCEVSDEVMVTVAFEASAGADQTICQGYSTTLTASEGDAYLWSTGETTQSITVNPSGTQTYTVTVYQGAFQDDADVTVSVNPNPNVIISNGGEVMILEGEFVTLSASGANSYLWNNGATQPNIAVSPSATTTYEVTGYINNCEDTSAVVVNVVGIVEADAGEDITICSEETVTLTATGGEEYLWNTGETTQSIEVSPDSDTEYSVLVYNALDSDEDTVMVFVEACNTIENPPPTETEAFDFIVYQEPTEDVLKVKINGLDSVTARGISIYDMSGKVLYTELFSASELENQSEMTRSINTSPYARGIYIVRLIYDDTSVLKKIPIR